MQSTIKPTWASITQRGEQNSSQPKTPACAILKHANPPPKQKKATASSPQDERLFLRLDKNHEWRILSLAGVREALSKHFHYLCNSIESVYWVRTDFALRAKDKESRGLLMSSADSLTSIGTKLERASDLAAIRISNVPVAITTLLGRIHVTEEMVTNEITRVTKAAPLKARPHGNSSLGAPYQSWLAYFEKATAPRTEFHLFDDSGVAVKHQPQTTLQQCKQFLGFHGTLGCSRAPACWNCTSKIHSTIECKAHIAQTAAAAQHAQLELVR